MSTTKTLPECLLDFKRRWNGATALLARFCQVTPDTASRWRADRLPVGMALLRLTHFLLAVGYKLDSEKDVHPAAQYIGKLVAFDVLTPQEALELMDVNNEHAPSYLGRVVRGSLTPHALLLRRVTLEELQSTYKRELEAKMQVKLPELAELRAAVKSTGPPTQEKTAGTVKEPRASSNHQAPDRPKESSLLVAMTGSALLSCIPLLRAVADQQSANITRQLREQVGEENFYALLDLLKSMSSREAGKFFRTIDPETTPKTRIC